MSRLVFVLSYLQVEWQVRRGTPRLFTLDNMRSSNCRVPQQDNSSDCGVYLLQYAESFLQVDTHTPAHTPLHWVGTVCLFACSKIIHHQRFTSLLDQLLLFIESEVFDSTHSPPIHVTQVKLLLSRKCLMWSEEIHTAAACELNADTS